MSIDELIPMVTLPEGTNGRWSIQRVVVTESFAMRVRERHFKPGTFTQLLRGAKLVMSDTPAERYDHAEFVRQATGHVLIAGLGLGMCLGAILRKPDVTRVTVLEIDPDLVALVGPHYPDPRVEIVVADAKAWKPPTGVRYGAVWIDIWDDICTDYAPEMATFHRRYGKRRADWMGCWGEPEMRRIQRQQQRESRMWGGWR